MRTEDKLFKARVSRHLLFNGLNSAMALCRRNPEDASRLLESLSHCLLYASEDKPELVPLADEISFTKSYLHIQSVRFGQRLQVHYKISDVSGRVPAFSLQPILDNVFSHVMLRTRENVALSIEVSKGEHGNILKVKDNQVGMEINQLGSFWQRYSGRSLHQLNQKLQVHGMKELAIDSQKGSGTCVTIHVKH